MHVETSTPQVLYREYHFLFPKLNIDNKVTYFTNYIYIYIY